MLVVGEGEWDREFPLSHIRVHIAVKPSDISLFITKSDKIVLSLVINRSAKLLTVFSELIQVNIKLIDAELLSLLSDIHSIALGSDVEAWNSFKKLPHKISSFLNDRFRAQLL